jgi:hypothetical protein
MSVITEMILDPLITPTNNVEWTGNLHEEIKGFNVRAHTCEHNDNHFKLEAHPSNS